MSPKTSKHKAEVRHRIWPAHNGEPKTLIKLAKGWRACKTLQEARDVARRHGYSGITVTLV